MSGAPPVDRNRAEKQLLVKLACQQIISNNGLQPTNYQWDDIASQFNASDESRSTACKTELLKLWRTLKAEADHTRRNFGDKVQKNPLLEPIDRLSRNSKSASKSKKIVIPQDFLRRSKRKLASEKTDDIDTEEVGLSDEVADVQEEFLDHLSFKQPKTVSKRTEKSRKVNVVIKKDKQTTKREEKCPARNTTTAWGSENGRKSCPLISPESSNVDARNIQSPNVSQPGTEAISCMPPRPGTPFPTPTFVRGTTGSGTPVYFRLDNNTETGDNGVLIAPDTGFHLNEVSGNAEMVRNNHVTVNKNVASMKVKNNLGTSKNNQGLFAMVANNHGRVTNITRDGSFIFPLKRDNPRMVTVSAGMVPNNAGMVSSNAGIMTSNAEMVTSNAGVVSDTGMVSSNAGMGSNNVGMVSNNAGMVSNNAGMTTNSNEVTTRKLVRIPRLKSPVILRRPSSPASGGNSQSMSPPFLTSTPEKTFLIPPSLLKDSTNIFARNEAMPQSRETRLTEEFQEIRIRQAKELQEVYMKIHEAQIMMNKKMAEQSQELHDAKMKTEALIAEHNRKFAEENLKLEEEKLKQSSELDQRLHDAKMRCEDEIAKQRNELQAANLRAIDLSMKLCQELHNVEMEAARLKRDEAATKNKIAMLQLKKVELELEQLNEMSAQIPQ